MTFTQHTGDIIVSVIPSYLPDQSDPDDVHFVWSYAVSIHNDGVDPIRLTHRHWRITDSEGRAQQVKGEGVVGEQPVITPGTSFSYVSGTVLQAPSGWMVGSYTIINMRTNDTFDIAVPAFSLDSERQLARPN